MTTNRIDWTKPLQTRDGQPFTLLFRNGRGLFPVGGYVGNDKHISPYTEEGRSYVDRSESPLDLINVPEAVVGWLNLYAHDQIAYGGITESRACADRASHPNRLALLKITYTPGQPPQIEEIK